MKLIPSFIAVAFIATIVSSGLTNTTEAISVPAKTYCINISPYPGANMGATVGCGYTYSECVKRLPSKLAAYKQQNPQYPKAVARCSAQ